VLDQRGQLLRAAVGFAGCSMLSYDRALWALRSWLDSWSGIGHVAVAMHRQGFAVLRCDRIANAGVFFEGLLGEPRITKEERDVDDSWRRR